MFLFNLKVSAKSVNVYFFYGDGCNYCKKTEKYLNKIKDDYDLNIYKYEVYNNKENLNKLKSLSKYLNEDLKGVLYVIINNNAIIGYSDNLTNDLYLYNIKKASKSSFSDKIGKKLGIKESVDASSKVNLFGLKEINLDNTNIVLSVILVAILNVFNPSIIWLFLLLVIYLNITKLNEKCKNQFIIMIPAIVYLILELISLKNGDKIFIMLKSILSLFMLCTGYVMVNKYLSVKNKKEGKLKIFLKGNKGKFFIIGLFLYFIILSFILFFTSPFSNYLLADLISSCNILLKILLSLLFIVIYYVLILLIYLLINFLYKLTNINNLKQKNFIIGILLIIISLVLIVKPELIMFY